MPPLSDHPGGVARATKRSLLCALDASASRSTRGSLAPRHGCHRQDRIVARRKEATMVPLLLWILGVPGLIIILLLLLGIIHL